MYRVNNTRLSEIHLPRTGTLLRAAPLVLAFLIVTVLAAYNLEYYPRTWFDEGMNLQAAKNLALSGRYGLQSSDGFRAFDTALTTGPTVIGTASLVFMTFDVGLSQARAVMVGYILLAAAGLYWVGKRLYGQATGIVAILVFASITEVGPFANGRHLLGEVAAVALLLWGTVLFIEAQEARKVGLYAGAGMLFGLAVLTKLQFVLLVPVVLVLWFHERARSGSFTLRQMMVLLSAVAAPVAVWYLYQYIVLGPALFLGHLVQSLGQASVSSSTSPLQSSARSLAQLIRSGFAAMGLVGLVYVWLLTLREQRPRLAIVTLLPLFVTLWLAWYVVFSVGWPRYVVPAALVSSLFVAKLFCDLGQRFTPLGRVRSRPSPREFIADPLGTALAVMLAAIIVSGTALSGLAIARANDDSPQRFASLVTQRVAQNSVIECFEWEITFLTDRTYHHPPVRLMDDATGVVFLNRSSTSTAWYQVPSDVAYLVDGPFSKVSGIYSDEIGSGEFKRIGSVGEYDLYRREPRQ